MWYALSVSSMRAHTHAGPPSSNVSATRLPAPFTVYVTEARAGW